MQELAFTLANAIAYIEAAAKRGLAVDDAPRLSYSLGCFRDLEEVACRAARRLYARIMKERFGARDPKSWLFRTFSGSCGSTLVAQQPLNNVVRVTLHALMGVLGGHQAIHTACWDEGFAIPSQEAATLALRTQQILAHESGLANTVDPLAGSYYVESLTDEIERRREHCSRASTPWAGCCGRSSRAPSRARSRLRALPAGGGQRRKGDRRAEPLPVRRRGRGAGAFRPIPRSRRGRKPVLRS